jgi:hypothetical protein
MRTGIRRSIARATLTLVASLASSLTAHAVTVELLVNSSFQSGDTAEWELCNPATNGLPTAGPLPCEPATSPGAFYVNNNTDCPGTLDADSAVLIPNAGASVAIRQRLITDQAVGRTVTVSWCGVRTAFSDRGIKMTLAYKRPLSAGGGYGTCTSTQALTSSWATYSANCNVPNPILQDIYVQFETTGTTGTVRLDALHATADSSGPAWSISKATVTTGTIDPSDEIVAVSARDNVTGRDGFKIREIYVTEADGSNPTRITNQAANTAYGQMHPAVSPDRTKIAVVRFMEDWNGDDAYTTTVDPQAIWIIDLSASPKKEWQLTPTWVGGGMGGVAWGADSSTVYYSVELGRQTRIYRSGLEGAGLTLLSDTTLNAWESDVTLTPDFSKVLFGAWDRNLDGTYAKKQTVWMMDADDGANRTQMSTGGADSAQYANIDFLPVGDYDPEMSPDGTQLLLWRNKVCTSPCDNTIEGMDLVKCTIGNGNCLANIVTVLRTGGLENFFLIADWGSPSSGNPIIIGNNDTLSSPTYFGLYSMAANGTNKTKEQSSSCTGATPAAECDVWPRWIGH